MARDEVTSFIREPFVSGNPADAEEQEPVQTGGPREAIGELVTCSRCVGTWAGAAIDVLAPRFGRVLTWSLSVGGANDWPQAGFAALTHAADRSGSS